MRKITVSAASVMLALAACGANPPTYVDAEATAPIRAAVTHPERSETDRARDAGRRPAEVLAFFGLAPSMRVLDVYAGGGYYTELIARTVGPGGAVVAHNNRAYLAFAADEIRARYAQGRLPNVAQLSAENNELALPTDYFDAVFLFLGYHDFYYVDENNGWPRIDGPKMLATIRASMKSGAVLGVVDHAAAAGAPADSGHTLHRIDPARARREIVAAGFEFGGESDLLRNADDDHTKLVFEDAVRGKTDRFVFRFTRP